MEISLKFRLKFRRDFNDHDRFFVWSFDRFYKHANIWNVEYRERAPVVSSSIPRARAFRFEHNELGVETRTGIGNVRVSATIIPLNNGDTTELRYYFPLRAIYGQSRRDRIQRRHIDLVRSIVPLYNSTNRLSLIKLVRVAFGKQVGRYSPWSRGQPS